jgi:hypothetical protein
MKFPHQKKNNALHYKLSLVNIISTEGGVVLVAL